MIAKINGKRRIVAPGFIVFAGIMLLLLISACNQRSEEDDAKIAKAEAQIEKLESLETALLVRDSMLNEMVTAFDKVDLNLEVIREKEVRLREFAQGEEVMGSHQDRIVRDIQLINTLMADNRSEIARLQKRLRTSGANLGALKARLDRLAAENEAKDEQLLALREVLVQREKRLAGLNNQLGERELQLSLQKELIDEQAVVLEAQEGDLNEAFFATGTMKELKSRGLVERKGGLLGLIGGHHIQKIEKGSAEFIRIDQRNHKSIPVFATKIELVTSHPVDSYELIRDANGRVSTLDITDPEAFWEASRYLIVATD